MLNVFIVLIGKVLFNKVKELFYLFCWEMVKVCGYYFIFKEG